jgi:hypothetical protein
MKIFSFPGLICGFKLRVREKYAKIPDVISSAIFLPSDVVKQNT